MGEGVVVVKDEVQRCQSIIDGHLAFPDIVQNDAARPQIVASLIHEFGL